MFLLCVIVLVAGIFAASRRGIRRQTIDSSPGRFLQAMDFSLPDLTDNRVSLSDFRNRVVLLTFWTTWCPPCIKEIAILKEIYARYNREDVEIIAVNIAEDRERLVRFKERENIPYHILRDEKQEVASLYRVIGTPTDIIIDRKGNVRYYNFYWPGDIKEVIEGLLAKQSSE